MVLARNSAITFVGNIIFRVGGYFYRFLMATLLGTSAYCILTLTNAQNATEHVFEILE